MQNKHSFFKVIYLHKGKRLQEITKSQSKQTALKAIQQKYPQAMLIQAYPTSTPLEIQFGESIQRLKSLFKKKIPMHYKISTIRQIAIMSEAGLPINKIVDEVAKGVNMPYLKAIYRAIHSDINAGHSLYDAFKPYKDVFGALSLTMIHLADKTGRISESFNTLADMLEVLQGNISSVKKALRIPLITLIAMFMAFIVIINVVVPKFKDVFHKFGAELPLSTQFLFGVEHFFTQYGLLFILLIIVGVVVGNYYYKHSVMFKLSIDKLLIHPRLLIVRPIVFYASMYKYNLVLTELIAAGVSVSVALDTAINTVENQAIKEKLLTVNSNIEKGTNLSTALEMTKLYDTMLLHMLKSGESAGQLEAMLAKVTKYYDAKYQEILEDFSTYIEPIMMFFMALLVLLLALGILMPMWDLSQVVKR